MKPITIFLAGSHAASGAGPGLMEYLKNSGLVEKVCIFSSTPDARDTRCFSMPGPITRGASLNTALGSVSTEYVLVINNDIVPGQRCLERLLDAAQATGASMVYPDYYLDDGHGLARRELIDYQFGSVREGFDFGSMIMFSSEALEKALRLHGPVADVVDAAFYDLRLKASTVGAFFHLRENLYTVKGTDSSASLFSYVDPRNRASQIEMEAVFTGHLKRIGAYLSPAGLQYPAVGEPNEFPVEASIVVPVRNRAGKIGDAIRGALSQKTDFTFNVIVVDNHSDDGTTGVVAGIQSVNPAVVHIIPPRRDLGIGGCWNEALLSPHCGRYAVQLDSDDLYSGPGTLQKIVDVFRSGNFAMVIGSYKLVNPALEEIPPGVIDHREWSDENGHNNALRINGLGAPRAFRTSVIRGFLFPDVSYGEDYAVCLRITRQYKVGRIFEPLYLCRRWEGNSDAQLPPEAANRNDQYKDSLRSMELQARINLNQTGRRRPQA